MSAFAWFRPCTRVVGVPSIVGAVVAVAAVVAGLLLCLSPRAAAVVRDDTSDSSDSSDRPWTWPLLPGPPIVQPFDPPDGPYAAGHRGVDLAGSVGQPVLAIAAGVVTYAGTLAGRGVVVVSHGELRSTYEPVSAAVALGDSVAVGQPIGTLAAVGSHCLPGACLHLGVLRDTEYVDPLSLLGAPTIRLKPLSGEPPQPAGPGSAADDAAVSAAGYPWPAVR